MAQDVRLTFKVTDEGTLRVLDQAGEELKQIGVEAEKAERKTNSAFDGMRSTANNARAGFSKMQAGIVTMNQGLNLASTAFGALGAVMESSFFGPLRQVDTLTKFSRQVGVSVEELTGFRVAAELSGVSMEGLGTGLAIFSQRMVEAQTGSKRMSAIFKTLGIDASQEILPAFLDVADAFEELGESTAATNLQRELFGRSGTQFASLLQSGSQAIREQADEARALGVVYDESFGKGAERINDNISRIKLAVEGLALTFLQEATPGILAATDAMVEWVKGNQGDVIGTIRDSFDGLADATKEVADNLSKIGGLIDTISGLIPSLDFTDFGADVAARRAAFRAANPELANADPIPPGGISLPGGGSQSVEAIDAIYDRRSNRAREVGALEQSILDLLKAQNEASSKGNAVAAARREESKRIAAAARAIRDHEREVADALKVQADISTAISTRASAAVGFAQQDLQIAQQRGATLAEQVVLAGEIDDLRVSELRTQEHQLQLQVLQAQAEGESTAALEAKIGVLQTQQERQAQFGEAYRVSMDAAKQATEAAADAALNLGEVLNNSLQRAVDSMLDGSFDFGDTLKATGKAAASEMFGAMLEEKLDFDLSIKKNFLEDIPGMFQGGMDAISSIWSGGMRGLSNDASQAADNIGGALGNIAGIGDITNAVNAGGSFSLGGGLFAGNNVAVGSDGVGGAVITNEFGQRFTAPAAQAGQAAGAAAGVGGTGASAALPGVGAIAGAALGAAGAAGGIANLIGLDKEETLGAVGGAAAGAIVGSVVPVIGTAIGAIVGGIVGALGGSLFGGGPTGEHLTAEGIDRLFDEAGVARFPRRRGLGFQDTLFTRGVEDIRSNRDTSNRLADTLFSSPELDALIAQRDSPGSLSLDERLTLHRRIFEARQSAQFVGSQEVEGTFRGQGGEAFGLATVFAENDQQAAIGFVNTFTNNMQAMGLTVEEGRDQLRRLAEEAGVTLTPALVNLNTQFLEGSIDIQQFRDAGMSLIEFFGHDLPAGVNASEIALNHFAQDGRLLVTSLNEELEQTVALFGQLESGATSAQSGALGAGIEQLVGGGSAAEFNTAIQQSVIGGVSGSLSGFLGTIIENQFGETFSSNIAQLFNDFEDALGGPIGGEQAVIEDIMATIRIGAASVGDVINKYAPLIEALQQAEEDFVGAVEASSHGLREFAEAVRGDLATIERDALSPFQRIANARADEAASQSVIDRILADGVIDESEQSEYRKALEDNRAANLELANAATSFSEGSQIYRDTMAEAQLGLQEIVGFAELGAEAIDNNGDFLTINSDRLAENTDAMIALTNWYQQGADGGGGRQVTVNVNLNNLGQPGGPTLEQIGEYIGDSLKHGTLGQQMLNSFAGRG